MLKKEEIYQRLRKVNDPELGINLVDLGLVYEVKLLGSSSQPEVHIKMTLTTPGCPLAGIFPRLIKDSLFGLPNLDVDSNVKIEIIFDPPWTMEMMSGEARAELGF